MSKDRQYGDWIANEKSQVFPTKKQIDAEYGSSLHNSIYSRALDGYLHCVATYFSKIGIPQLLEQQLTRNDIDTVCGYELFQMKQLFLETDVLEYKRFLEPRDLPQ